LFEKFDKDRSGRITSSDFQRAFEGLGFSTSQYDVEDLMRRIDDDGDGSIDFNEFVNAALRPAGGSKSGSYRHYAAAVDEKLRKLVRDAKFSEAAIKKLFSKFDRNGSGSITVGEFKRGFMEMGIQTSTKEITDLIDRLDR
jgi:Ca2+-binding EF-hand superfamily protein